MELEFTAFYCLCDDFLISEGWLDDRQCAMSTAEVMTAAAFFSGSYEKSGSGLNPLIRRFLNIVPSQNNTC